MFLTVLIPAHNEEGSIRETVEQIHQTLTHARITHEILVVEDHCNDRTSEVLREVATRVASLRIVVNRRSAGYGMAVRYGLEQYRGDAIVITMADGSDSAADIVRYCEKLSDSGIDCVFGSRFVPGAKVSGYPIHKLVINRIVNRFIQVVFAIRCNDTTNAFKCFRREVIDGIQPLLSPHFNLTVELPLKAIIRGYRFAVVPISWTQRKSGISKLKLREMGSRYLFIVIYCLIEKWLSRGDYRREESSRTERAAA